MVVTVGADPAIDQLLLMYDHPAGLAPESEASWERVRAGLAAGGTDSEAGALIASTLPDLLHDGAARELAARGIPAIAGLRTALLCAQALRRQSPGPARLRAIADLAARARSAHADSENGWLDEAEAKALLAAGGVVVPPGAVTEGEDESVEAALALGLPVALKLCDPDLRHKTQAGAIVLDVASEEEVRAAHRDLLRSAAGNGERVLVERMVEPGLELLVSARTDAVVPALVVGLGGVWAEALDEVAIVPLPADESRVLDAIRSLRGADRDELDLAAVAAAGARVGELAIERGLDLLELNPVVVHASGCVAVDSLAHRA
jgi:acyl-CoA synthetase (NDP forming)